MITIPADAWVRQRLISRGVYEEGGQWLANLRGTAIGSYATQLEALHAYKKAARERFREQAMLPSDPDLDAALAAGPIVLSADAAAQQASPQSTQPVREHPKPEPKQAPKPAPKPAAKPTSHRR